MKLLRPIIDWNARYILSENITIIKKSINTLIVDISLPAYTDSYQIKKIEWSSMEPSGYQWVNHLYKPIELNIDQSIQLTRFLAPRKLTDVFEKKELLKNAKLKEFITCMRSLGFLSEYQVSPNDRIKCKPGFGILTLAVGDQYIKMAAALAMSIKAQNKDIPFAIVTNDKKHNILKTYSEVFDKIITINLGDYHINEKVNPYYVKTNINVLTPFKQTLFLDADSILFQEGNIIKLVNNYGNCDIAPGVSLAIDDINDLPKKLPFNWGLTSQTLKDLGVKGRIARIHSYYFYMNGTKRTEDFCALTRDIYKDFSKSPKMQAYYSNHLTDEIPWFIASAFSPVTIFSHFHMPMGERMFFRNAMLERSVLAKHFEGITLVGKKLSPPLLKLYNEVVEMAAQKLKLPKITWNFNKDGSLC